MFSLRFGRHDSLELDQLEQRGHRLTCALIGTNRKLAAYSYTSSQVDANGVCQGIQKVRVEPATRSAVATCNNLNINISLLNIELKFSINFIK